jgi:hypothetical protein
MGSGEEADGRSRCRGASFPCPDGCGAGAEPHREHGPGGSQLPSHTTRLIMNDSTDSVGTLDGGRYDQPHFGSSPGATALRSPCCAACRDRTAGSRPYRRGAGASVGPRSMGGPEDGRRPSGPPGKLDELDADSVRAAGRQGTGVHLAGSRGDRAGNGRVPSQPRDRRVRPGPPPGGQQRGSTLGQRVQRGLLGAGHTDRRRRRRAQNLSGDPPRERPHSGPHVGVPAGARGSPTAQEPVRPVRPSGAETIRRALHPVRFPVRPAHDSRRGV